VVISREFLENCSAFIGVALQINAQNIEMEDEVCYLPYTDNYTRNGMMRK
jgi:hypothetical protein